MGIVLSGFSETFIPNNLLHRLNNPFKTSLKGKYGRMSSSVKLNLFSRILEAQNGISHCSSGSLKPFSFANSAMAACSFFAYGFVAVSSSSIILYTFSGILAILESKLRSANVLKPSKLAISLRSESNSIIIGKLQLSPFAALFTKPW